MATLSRNSQILIRNELSFFLKKGLITEDAIPFIYRLIERVVTSSSQSFLPNDSERSVIISTDTSSRNSQPENYKKHKLPFLLPPQSPKMWKPWIMQQNDSSSSSTTNIPLQSKMDLSTAPEKFVLSSRLPPLPSFAAALPSASLPLEPSHNKNVSPAVSTQPATITNPTPSTSGAVTAVITPNDSDIGTNSTNSNIHANNHPHTSIHPTEAPQFSDHTTRQITINPSSVQDAGNHSTEHLTRTNEKDPPPCYCIECSSKPGMLSQQNPVQIPSTSANPAVNKDFQHSDVPNLAHYRWWTETTETSGTQTTHPTQCINVDLMNSVLSELMLLKLMLRTLLPLDPPV